MALGIRPNVARRFHTAIAFVWVAALALAACGTDLVSDGANTASTLSSTASDGGSTITMGETHVLGGTDSGNGNLLTVQQATLAQAATLSSLSFYVLTASGNLELGVYDATGAGGGPGALKAATGSFAPAAGWNTQSVSAPVLLPAGSYWLAYLPSSDALTFAVDRATVSANRWVSYTFAPMPASFPTSGVSSGTSHWSLYATLNIQPSVTASTLAATGIAAAGATLNGSANPNGSAATGWFRYATTNPGTCNDTFGTRAPTSGGASLSSGTTTVPFSQTLTGLTGGTTYYFCAIASNAGGTRFGSVLSFTTATAATTFTMGETNVLSGTDSGNGNLLTVQQATLAQGATLSSLSFYVVTASGNLELGVYDATGAGGGPGALKAQTGSFTPTAGWNTHRVSSSVLLAAGTYWLAYLPSSDTLSFAVDRSTQSANWWVSYTFAPMPAAFPTSGVSSGTSHWSLYATLNAGPCAPSCGGKVCGSDGCDGSCGTCASGTCNSSGQCGCTPSCSGKQCGPDGCGGTCGTCSSGTCSASGQCTAGSSGPLVGLYSWGEIATYETQIKTMGEPIHRLGGTIDDTTWAACLGVGAKIMFTVGGTDVTSTLANIDTALKRYGPGGTYWVDNPTATNHPIEAIEVLNEPNFYGISASTYASVLVAAYPHIKASWPTVTVVGFSCGDASAACGGFLQQVYAANPAAFKSMDVFSLHPYTGPIAPDQNLSSQYFGSTLPAHIVSLRSQAASYGLSSSIPWWVTEIGYKIDQASGGTFADSTGTVTPSEQAAYNIRYDLLAIRQNIARVYHMFTDDSDGFNGGYFANSTGAARPVATATRQMLALLNGYTSMDMISEDYGGGNPFVYRFHTPTKTVIVAWAQTPQTASIALSGTTTVTDMLGNVLATTTQSSYSAALSETPIFLVSQ
jgi:hypothetical protein